MTIPRFWRELDERYNLRGMECGNCGHVMFPPRNLCPECRHESVGKLQRREFSGDGTIESFTVVHAAAPGFDLQTPYVMAVVKLAEGPRVTAQVVDVKPDAVAVGMKVHRTFRRINQEGESGVVQYGFKFVPSVGAAAGGRG